MKLRITEQGDRETSNKLFDSLNKYLIDMIASLRAKNFHTSADVIEQQLVDVRKQYGDVQKANKFISGWN